MPTDNLTPYDERYFACGLSGGEGEPAWAARLRALGPAAHILRYPGGGFAFYTLPPLVDAAEDEDVVVLKMGLAHDGEHALNARDLLLRHWAAWDGIETGSLQGSPLVVVLLKKEPRAFVYRGLFATAAAHYWSGERSLLVSDNLRLMVEYLPDPQMDESALPQHFLFRASFGAATPVKGVSRLCEGELLDWGLGGLAVKQKRDLRPLIHRESQQPYQPRHAVELFEGMKKVMGLYLDGRARQTATMLSGGIDSSLLQAAVNALPEVDFRFPSFSYTSETEDLRVEMENARVASVTLGTDHTFVPMTAEEYCDSLAKSIEALGQPVTDDVRPCFFHLAGRLAEIAPGIEQLVHGHIAEAFFGSSSADRMTQGERYRRWPLPALWLAGKLLAPVSRSKAYGAQQALTELKRRRNMSKLEFMVAMPYTDKDMMLRCFSEAELRQAAASRNQKAQRYIDAGVEVERHNSMHLFDAGVGSGNITRQLGQFHGKEYVFPYADEIVAKIAFSITPATRYACNHVVKHTISDALKVAVPAMDVERPKGWSSMGQAQLFAWMREGALRDMVRAIDRPGFIGREDFERKLAEPDWFTWNLLTLDLLKKRVFS